MDLDRIGADHYRPAPLRGLGYGVRIEVTDDAASVNVGAWIDHLWGHRDRMFASDGNGAMPVSVSLYYPHYWAANP